MRPLGLVLLATSLLGAGTASAHEVPKTDMGLAIRATHQFLSLDRGVPGSMHGLAVSQHARFDEHVGAQVTVSFATGVDPHGYGRTDLEFVMPAILLFFGSRDHVRPYFSTGFVMTTSFYHGSAPSIGGMVYAGNRTSLGFEWHRTKKLSFLFELSTTVRGRFAVDKEDQPVLAENPVFDRASSVVHEGGLSLGVVLY